MDRNSVSLDSLVLTEILLPMSFKRSQADDFKNTESLHSNWLKDIATIYLSIIYLSIIITFRGSRRRHVMYIGDARLSVCLCVYPLPYSHTTARTRM